MWQDDLWVKDEDYYSILKVDKSADFKSVKVAFRRQSRKYHPDLYPDDAEKAARFRFVQEAYGILSDKRKRLVYDYHGRYSPELVLPDSELCEPVWALIEGAMIIETGLTYQSAEEKREIYTGATIVTSAVAARLSTVGSLRLTA